jgi:hypothetical protein
MNMIMELLTELRKALPPGQEGRAPQLHPSPAAADPLQRRAACAGGAAAARAQAGLPPPAHST